MKVIGDKILVKPFETKESKTPSGIITATESQEKQRPTSGVVVAVGTGKVHKGHRVEPFVQVGDHVVWDTYSGDDVELDDGKHIVLTEEKILMVMGR